MAKYKYGELLTVQHEASSDIAVGDVVVFYQSNGRKTGVGVAMENIANGDTGAVAATGIFELAKTSSSTLKAGRAVHWDASNAACAAPSTTPAAGDVVEFGRVMKDAGNGVEVVEIDIGPLGTYNA